MPHLMNQHYSLGSTEHGGEGNAIITPLSKSIRSKNGRSFEANGNPDAVGGATTSDHPQKSTVTPTNGIHNSEIVADRSSVHQYGTNQYIPITSSGAKGFPRQSAGPGEATEPQNPASSGGWYSPNGVQQRTISSQYGAMQSMRMNQGYYPGSYQNYSPLVAPRSYYMGSHPYYSSPQPSHPYSHLQASPASANSNNRTYSATVPPTKNSRIRESVTAPVKSSVNSDFQQYPTPSSHANANTSASPKDDSGIQHDEGQKNDDRQQLHGAEEKVQVIENDDEPPPKRSKLESNDEDSSDDESSSYAPASKSHQSTPSLHAQPPMPPPQPPAAVKKYHLPSAYSYINQSQKVHIDKADSSNMPLDGIFRNDFVMPEFNKLINYRIVPNHFAKKKNDEMTCVMCGIERPYKQKKEFLNVGHFIPSQNKGLCTDCDISVWKIKKSDHLIRWCKGCKNFQPWKSFGDRSFLTKCITCRDKQKEKYLKRKMKGMEYKSEKRQGKGANGARTKDQGLSFLIAATARI